ncbi:glycosyltransferase family 2 protein [Accumulibacter sp.]|uniref:glycosyltransferase family 2 protein n=1 Tax=Accumulibacter sp. TaxID=2053492 RepID=UPI0025EB2D36|nr:glycosyltransferase family 2 protein [Accumulibacter sp.]MCM8613610.1 glycosyltransferase [Accumulibacter sp.]MCM8637362.1 glycosyltransferase [Accumulibacter sp.]MCM8638968.1 glycosyltransferase [Accumulibacter sp.]
MNKQQYPLVSIITPALNRGEHIENCLRSIQGQTYQNIEHVVVDGLSTDNTLSILERYADKYNLRWVSEKDSGMYDAIGKGMRMANGTILAYLNTDDLYFPWSVQVAVDAILAGHPIVFGDGCIVQSKPERLSTELSFSRSFNFEYYKDVATLMQPTVFFDRVVLEKIGHFDPSFRLLADCNYWLRCAQNGFPPSKIPEMMAVQIDHGETLRETYRDQLYLEFARLRGHASGKSHLRWMARVRRLLATRVVMARFSLSYGLNGRLGWQNFIEWASNQQSSFNLAACFRAGLPQFLKTDNTVKSAINTESLLSLCTNTHRR